MRILRTTSILTLNGVHKHIIYHMVQHDKEQMIKKEVYLIPNIQNQLKVMMIMAMFFTLFHP